MKFYVWMEKEIDYKIWAKEFVGGNPGEKKEIPKLGETDPNKWVTYDHDGNSNEEFFIWVDDPHISKLRLKYSNKTSPEGVTVTVGEK